MKSLPHALAIRSKLWYATFFRSVMTSKPYISAISRRHL